MCVYECLHVCIPCVNIMRVYECICVCVRACVRLSLFFALSLSRSLYIILYVKRPYACMYELSVDVSNNFQMSACMCVYIHIHIHTRSYIHTGLGDV